jgi:hypothetical protein
MDGIEDLDMFEEAGGVLGGISRGEEGIRRL